MSHLRLRVVSYKEDGLWVAHCLEMDVIGVGAAVGDALEELKSNIEAQLSFAKFEGIDPFRPAPEKIQNLWNETNLSVLGISKRSSRRKQAPETSVMEWTKTEVTKLARAFQGAC